MMPATTVSEQLGLWKKQKWSKEAFELFADRKMAGMRMQWPEGTELQLRGSLEVEWYGLEEEDRKGWVDFARKKAKGARA